MRTFKSFIVEGRPSQRHPLEGHEYHKKSDAELRHIAKDAHEAAEAMKGHNTNAENKYRDQANDSATVRYYRQKNGMPDWYKKKYGHMKEEVELDERCWPGYKPTPGKKAYDKGSCIKEESNLYTEWENKEPVKYAKYLTEHFGTPDEITNKRAVWYNKDGFKRIEVLDEYILHASPLPHYDFVYCYVDLKVPHKFANKLAESSESITVDFLKNEVGARCASLSANAVTLQYVLDVVEEKIAPSKAIYESRIKAMKNMFASGQKFELDWWPDESGDADPKNPYYKESVNEDWQKVNKADKTDGLSQKAVNAYRRENPGSKLQTAVTEKNPTGKRAKRRLSFCRRMGGMKKRLTNPENARDPDSPINKALRRWNC